MSYENLKQSIHNELGEYKLGLIISGLVYYVNDLESDENACVILLNTEGELLSDNYFAYNSFFEDLEKVINGSIEYEFISPELLKSAKEYFEEYEF